MSRHEVGGENAVVIGPRLNDAIELVSVTISVVAVVELDMMCNGSEGSTS